MPCSFRWNFRCIVYLSDTLREFPLIVIAAQSNGSIQPAVICLE